MVLVVVSGCTSEQMKRATYDALHDRQCIKEVGYPNCDPNRPSYDQYKKEKEQATTPSSESTP